MKNKKYYSGVQYSKRDGTKTAVITLTVILFFTAVLIVWAIVTFANGGKGVFENESTQISNLKIENERLRLENEDLKKEIEEYKNSEQIKVENPSTTPIPTADNSEEGAANAVSPTPKPSNTPKPTVTPQQTPTPSYEPTYEEPADVYEDTANDVVNEPIY